MEDYKLKSRTYKGKPMSEMKNEEVITLHYNLALNEYLIDTVDTDDFYEAVSMVQAELVSRMN